MAADVSPGKIYVGGLNFSTTTDALKAHFEQFGKISDCIVMTEKDTGRSRGFGFVTFEDPGSANAAVAMPTQQLDGRSISAKKATRDGGKGGSKGGGGDNGIASGAEYNAVKIFVGGLPASVDYDKLTGFFQKFGTIQDAVVMMDSSTQRSRGFGFVTFTESAAVELVMQTYNTNEIDGKWIEVKRCIPQDKMAPGQSTKGKGKGGSQPPPDQGPPPMMTAPAPGFPGAYGAYGAYPPAYGAYPGYGYAAPPAYGYPGYGYPGFGAPPPPAYGAYGTYGALPPQPDAPAEQRSAPY
eukprot:TRINITY_DN92808_c0_g1_i1.p1 TRINITY_DN92808_c0_g1~~TRINITY_DN92808_c0_g1_i1.p1  ORF type:complete len:296 (+),score=63.73 TRINITY_DN92808_c0_g1_i1:42-929(+)